MENAATHECSACGGTGRQETHSRWKNARQREVAETYFQSDGFRLVGVYGGIGTFGGSEVGVFERACSTCAVAPIIYDGDGHMHVEGETACAPSCPGCSRDSDGLGMAGGSGR